MRRFLILLTPLLAGCASGFGSTQKGPATSCSTCEQTSAAVPEASSAAAAAATGGQSASNQPMQGDHVPLKPITVVSSGAGAATVNPTQSDTRSQAGAPSVNQGLVIPNSADARAGGGVSPVVASLSALVDDLREQLRQTQDPSRVASLLTAISDAHAMMAQAQASSNAQTVNNYHFDGARVVQSVANGSNSGSGEASPATPAFRPEAISPASRAAEKVMEPNSAPEGSAESLHPSPSSEPPAGGGVK